VLTRRAGRHLVMQKINRLFPRSSRSLLFATELQEDHSPWPAAITAKAGPRATLSTLALGA
jgi:hypothetical protein